MKKFMSIALAAAMSVSMAASVSAANNPKVYVDDAIISFNDQEPEIVEGRTLVPARGVFEAMNLDVTWEAEKRRVRINTEDNLIRIYLIIDDPVMEVYHFQSMLSADKTDVTLDVAPQIMNDRTMIPLRAISEALNCTVDWDQDAYAVYIKTADYEADSAQEAIEPTATADPEATVDPNATDAPEATSTPAVSGKTAMSITASADSVSEGETVDIYVNIANPPADAGLSSVSTLVSYSKADFKYESCTLYRDGADFAATIGASNPDYLDDAVKIALVTTESAPVASGAVAKLTFRALTSNGGDFALVNEYDTYRGYSNTFTFTDNSGEMFGIKGNDLVLDTTPVTVSGK